jgi:hypothetical protein
MQAYKEGLKHSATDPTLIQVRLCVALNDSRELALNCRSLALQAQKDLQVLMAELGVAEAEAKRGSGGASGGESKRGGGGEAKGEAKGEEKGDEKGVDSERNDRLVAWLRAGGAQVGAQSHLMLAHVPCGTLMLTSPYGP